MVEHNGIILDVFKGLLDGKAKSYPQSYPQNLKCSPFYG